MKIRVGTRALLLILVSVGAPVGTYHVFSRLPEIASSIEASELLLPSLSVALVVLTLGLAGVLIRNLVRLIIERKRGILGSTLRTKLVFFYLALVLVPALILFSGSVQIIKQTVEAILRTPLEQLTGGRELVDSWHDFFKAECARRASSIAREVRDGDLLRPERADQLRALLNLRLEGEQVRMIRVYAAGRMVAGASRDSDPTAHGATVSRADARLARMLEHEAPEAGVERLGDALVALAVAPVDPALPGSGAIAVSLLVPTPIAESMGIFSTAGDQYGKFRAQRRELVRFYVVLIALIFIATLFVATWLGFYLARRITAPIQEMAAAAREISSGNLGVRVHTRVGDEVGMLVDAFNEMAAELQENREVITRSTADLRRSNRELDERRRYIETLVAHLSTAVISLDPEGRVATANPAVREILGFELAAGDDAREIFRQQGLGPLADLLDQAFRDGAAEVRRDLQLSERTPIRHLAVQVSPLRGRTGVPPGSLLMVEDLTDLLRAQKALAWQEVARRIAHEIKNPLTPIQLAAQRLRKKFFAGADDLNEVLLESTASIEQEVGGLKHLVDEFSRFARMPEIEPRPVDLSQVVESALVLFQGLGDIEWQLDLDQRVGIVHVDAEQIRRVLINLIDNAVSAVGGHGSIRVSTRAVPERGVRIEVADSGPGIPQQDRDKMFAPYFSTKPRGSGLGLAIVHKVITEHRGTIRIEDNLPHGARFVIDLPA